MTSEFCVNHPKSKTLPHRNVCAECQKIKNLDSWQRWRAKDLKKKKETVNIKYDDKPIIGIDNRLEYIARKKFKDIYYDKNPIAKYIMGI